MMEGGPWLSICHLIMLPRHETGARHLVIPWRLVASIPLRLRTPLSAHQTGEGLQSRPATTTRKTKCLESGVWGFGEHAHHRAQCSPSRQKRRLARGNGSGTEGSKRTLPPLSRDLIALGLLASHLFDNWIILVAGLSHPPSPPREKLGSISLHRLSGPAICLLTLGQIEPRHPVQSRLLYNGMSLEPNCAPSKPLPTYFAMMVLFWGRD